MPFRRAIFWVHLCAGVSAALFIVLMSVTGVLLTYELQITNWANRHYHQSPPTPDAPQLTVAELLDVVPADKSRPTSVTFHSDPSAPATVSFGRAKTVYVNPYTGAVHGEGSARAKAFFDSMKQWHRWLALSGDQRATGRAITGAANLIFLFLVISGLYLWLPRRWTARAFGAVTFFQRGLRGKTRDWNWHHVIGIWCWLPLLVIVASGVVMSYSWANNLLYQAVGETPPASGPPAGRPQSNSGRARASDPTTALQDVDQALVVARDLRQGWRTISLTLPQSDNAPLVFTFDEGTGRQPQKRTQLTMARSGEVISWEPFSSQSLGRRLRSLVRFGHTGEAGGLIGQTVAGLASLGAVVLGWTGLTLAYRRLVPRRKRAVAQAELQLAD